MWLGFSSENIFPLFLFLGKIAFRYNIHHFPGAPAVRGHFGPQWIYIFKDLITYSFSYPGLFVFNRISGKKGIPWTVHLANLLDVSFLLCTYTSKTPINRGVNCVKFAIPCVRFEWWTTTYFRLRHSSIILLLSYLIQL